MRYEGTCYPPPTERDSYLLRVTLGCSHNKCKFCNFYKGQPFQVRPFEEVDEEIVAARNHYEQVSGVFLTDGNVTCLSMGRLRPILKKIKTVFPEAAHTNMYGTFRDINKKSVAELREMKEHGVRMITAGLESGSDIVLSDMDTGYTADEAIAAGEKMNEAGVGLVTVVILGLGGVKHSEEHVRGTVRVLNELNPARVGIAVCVPFMDTPLFNDIQSGFFKLPTYEQIFWEEVEIVRGLKFQESCILSTGHFYPYKHVVEGQLPYEKEKMLQEVENRAKMYSKWLDKKIYVSATPN